MTAMETALANVEAKIVEVSANPKPEYTIDGKTVKWSDYFRMLMENRKEILAAAVQENPYYLKSQVM